MPVDSRDKRSSAINVSSPWRGMLPVPDGAINQADRQHAAFMYRGISAGVAEVVADFCGLYLDWIGRCRRKVRRKV